MDELERRLRAAMTAVAEQPPPGLIDAVRLRHQRHRRRMWAGSVAGVAAVGVTMLPFVLQPSAQPGRPGALASSSRSAVPQPYVFPGTVRFTCNDADWGQLPAGWQAYSVRIGPVWLVPMGDHNPSVHSIAVEVRFGDAVTLNVSGSRSDLHLGSLVPGSAKTLPRGKTGFTFSSCSNFRAPTTGPNGPFTDFIVGYNLPAGRSGVLDVWIPGSKHPAKVAITCGHSGAGCGFNGKKPVA